MDKRGIVGTVIFVGILVVVGFFWFLEESGIEESECVRVDTECCSCANGGGESCVLKSEAEKIEKEKNCSEDVFCATVYSCEIESCVYAGGECVAG